MKKRKLILMLGAGVVVLGALGFGAYWLYARNTPEARLYRMLAQDVSQDVVGMQEVLGENAKGALEAAFDKDGKYKAGGALECTSSVPNYGDLKAVTSVRQIEEKLFLRTDEVVFSNGEDPASDKELNDYYKKAVGKWVLMDGVDEDIKGYKEQGVIFGMLGAYSKDMNSEEIAQKLREYKVITLLDSRNTTYKSEPVQEYDLLIRRSAYEKFMDAVKPDFKYKEAVLDLMFADDTEEVTLVTNPKDVHKSYATINIPNPCYIFLSEFDTTAAEDLTTRVKVKATPKANSNIAKLGEPEGFLTETEYASLFEEPPAQ
jgi:hypothetical protein